MRKIIIITVLLSVLCLPVMAMEFTAPAVPQQAEGLMPKDTETFAQGLWYVFKESVKYIYPGIAEASEICLGIIGIVLLASLLKSFAGMSGRITELVCVLGISALLLKPSGTLLQLGLQTVDELSEYGKLLLPVMTGAMAAQGGVTASAALYTGTAFFNALLSTAVSKLIAPMLCIHLCLSIANSGISEEILGQMKTFIKWLMTWSLKIVLYAFTGYMTVTGVVSGSADAAAVKAAKIAISGAVPVVGGILSDASEAILVSAGIMKSAAGIYGILALLAICAGPFVKIGVQYLLLKLTAAICGVFGVKSVSGLVGDFSGMMGFLLAMTGTVCLLLLISTVCFLRGVG